METKSIERLNKLHPKIRQIAINAYNEAVKNTPKGVHPFIDQTLRTFAESDKLFNQPHDGKDNDGDGKIDEADEKVTNAPGGSSYHNYGLALDFHLQIDGHKPFDVWPDNPEKDKNWMIVVNTFKKYGFKWGADWDGDGKTRAQGDKDEKLVDAPHFEMTLGHHWKDLLSLYKAGKVDENGYVLI